MKGGGQPIPLDEDAYHDGLAHVIQRDYFPQLSELRDAHEYLLADKADDFARKHHIEARKRAREEHAEEKEQEGARGLESVDAFLNTWTSEDNFSFVVLQEEELAQRRANDAWGKRAAEWKAREAEKKLLLLENGPNKGQVLSLGEGEKLLAITNGDESKEVYGKQLARAAVDWKQRVIDMDNTRLTRETQAMLSAPPKVIDPEKKRKKLSLLVQKNRFLEGASLGGRQTIDLDDFYDVPKEESQVVDVPTVQGFGFVATPVIVPGQAGGESPLVSWGRVEGTPVVLDHGRGRQFRIPDVPERDKVAQRLAEQKLKRTPVAASPLLTRTGKTPLTSPVFSPAGQKLLDEQRLRKQSPVVFKTPALPTGAPSLARPFPSPARK